MYAYAFLGEFVLLYPVYALLFAETGLSAAQISSLFAIWSITSFALEVPSGVWADATSRRRLLVAGPLLSALGFALWVIAPSYPAFAAGFVLWGAAGALQSGALEALVYEELDRAGVVSRYAQVLGRSAAIGTMASALAIGLAAPVFATGGFVAVGAASVVACLAAGAVGAAFPEHRRPGDGHGGAGLRAYAAVLRSGAGEVRSQPALRAAVLLVPGVSAIWGALDEYVPLLAAATGVGPATVPVLFGLVYAGVALGGLLGGRAGRLSTGTLAALLAAAAGALALGAISGLAAGFVLLAVGFGIFQAVTVAAEARLQHAITGPARSTVTSLAGLVTEVAVLAVFAGYGAGSALAGHATLFACFALVYLVLAALLALRAAGRRTRARASGLLGTGARARASSVEEA